MKIQKIFLYNIILISFFTGCSKFLDKKSDKSLSIGTSVADIQALLDYSNSMNISYPVGEASSDNYYLEDDIWSSLDEDDRDMYTWSSLYTNTFSTMNVWGTAYKAILNSNTAIEKISGISGKGTTAWNNVYGSALFYRSFFHYKIALLFANTYDSSTAPDLLGIPLRLNSNFNEVSKRGTLQATFDQIISDVHLSLNYLTNKSQHVLRPSKEAAFALLSQIYLYLGNYKLSNEMADSCLSISTDLLDYNQLDSTKLYPYTQFNKEVIFEMGGSTASTINAFALVDSLFYQSYTKYDLRRSLYFKLNTANLPVYYGSYDGMDMCFMGFARDEIYITKAECLIRLGRKAESIQFLNTLLQNRYKKDIYIPYTASISDIELLKVILQERRKELPFRDIRWMDIKRLNRLGGNINLKRVLNGQEYDLNANSKGFALPIPSEVILESGMQQN